MRVLLTGASSFSGCWFVEKLSDAGFAVTAPLRAAPSAYTGLRGERVSKLAERATLEYNCPFGSPAFFDLISRHTFEVLCHHAAVVTDYRSLEFDVSRALAENTKNLRITLERMRASGLKAVILTGSVFEANEGAGDEPRRAFSPYGLSKGFTANVVQYWCDHFGIPFGKFVIANPFGPWEEPRFCAYLHKSWRAGQTAEVRTPEYVRDNIHVDLLALAYASFVERVLKSGCSDRFGPIGYAETQGAFAERYAQAMRPRLGLDCAVRLLEQTEFSEPRVRINTNPIDAAALGWRESEAWDAIAAYYRSTS